MQTKREYLVEKGLAKAGRGRLSLAAKEEIKKAINKGVKFGDGASSNSTDVANTAPPRGDRPEGMYTFINPDGTTFKRLHTVACVGCSFSLQWCRCVEGSTLFIHPYQTGSDDQRATIHAKPKAVITTNDVPEKQPQQGIPRRGRGRPRGSVTRKAA